MAPLYLLESKEENLCSNVGILGGRKGEIVCT